MDFNGDTSCLYSGDFSSADVLEHCFHGEPKIIISTTPDTCCACCRFFQWVCFHWKTREFDWELHWIQIIPDGMCFPHFGTPWIFWWKIRTVRPRNGQYPQPHPGPHPHPPNGPRTQCSKAPAIYAFWRWPWPCGPRLTSSSRPTTPNRPRNSTMPGQNGQNMRGVQWISQRTPATNRDSWGFLWFFDDCCKNR